MPSSFFLNAISGANKEVAYLEKLTSRLAGKKRVSKPLHSHVGDLQRFFFSRTAQEDCRSFHLGDLQR